MLECQRKESKNLEIVNRGMKVKEKRCKFVSGLELKLL